MSGERVLCVCVCAGARVVVSEGCVCAVGRETRASSHRVPADHATSEVLVRALHARVNDVHAHAAAREVAIIVDAVDRAACVRRERATRVKEDDQGAIVVSCAEAVLMRGQLSETAHRRCQCGRCPTERPPACSACEPPRRTGPASHGPARSRHFPGEEN